VRVYRVRDAVAAAKNAPPVLPLPDKPSIAVLPFANMSGDPEQKYFADGMVEEIITALSRIRWLFVIARNSSLTYKGQPVDVKRVGRELGVRYVLEGSVPAFSYWVGVIALDHNPLDLIEADLIAPAIVELRRTRRGMVRHRRSVFQGAAVLRIRGDARRPEAVVPELGLIPAAAARRRIIA
jgi:hypothetical protein